jgi:hypothetical protein
MMIRISERVSFFLCHWLPIIYKFKLEFGENFIGNSYYTYGFLPIEFQDGVIGGEFVLHLNKVLTIKIW